MSLTYAEEAIKIGFVGNNDVVFAQEDNLSIDQQKELLYTTSNQKRCYDDVIFVDETRYNNEVPNPENTIASTTIISLPTNEELTTPPQIKNEDLKNVLPYVLGGIGAFLIIKLLA
jgi:hypothetical protein